MPDLCDLCDLCDLSATVPVLDCVATPPAYVSRLTPGFPAVFLNQSVVIGCRSAGAQEGSRVGFAGGAASSESPRIGTGSCVTWSSPCVSVAADRVVSLCVSQGAFLAFWGPVVLGISQSRLFMVVGFAVRDCVLVPCAIVFDTVNSTLKEPTYATRTARDFASYCS